MDVPAGNALHRPLHRRRHRSRPIPGAAASPSRPPPASPAAPTRPPPRPRSSQPSSAPPQVSDFAIVAATASSIPARTSGPTAASSCTTRTSPRPPAASTPSSSARRCAASPRCATAPATIPSSPRSSISPPTSKAVLGPGTKVTYAADWSEYFGHQPPDGSGDVYFHLDPLWASAAIDAIGIDVYWPLADWRDGADHARPPGRRRSRPTISPTCAATSPPARATTGTTPAPPTATRRSARPSPTAPGKPWVFRFKDIRSWWLERALRPPRRRRVRHAHAPGCPQSKPIWFTELGCPAVDKGANQPNVFVDPEELRVVPALLLARHAATTSCSAATCRRSTTAFDPADPDYVAGANPLSTVYAGRMLDLDHIHVYCLGRAALSGLPRQHRRLGRRRQLAARPLDHRPPRQRAAGGHRRRHPRRLRLCRPRRQPARRHARRLRHRPRAVRARGPAAARARLLHRRARERRAASSSPTAARSSLAAELTPDDPGRAPPRRGRWPRSPARRRPTCRPPPSSPSSRPRGAYPPAVEEARRLAGHSGRVAVADLPLVLDAEQAAQMAEVWLFEAWAARERAAVRAAAEPPRAGARRYRLARSRRPLRACCASPRSASTARATSRRAASIPTSTRGASPACARRPRAALRRVIVGQPLRGCSSTCRCCAATSRRTPAMSPPRRAPGPAPSPSTARRRAPASCSRPWRRRPPSPASRSIPCPPPPTSRFDRASRVPRAPRPGRARLRDGAGPARRRQPRRRPERRRRVGGAAVPVGRAHRARHLRALAPAARPGRHRGRHARARSPPAPASSCSMPRSRASTWRPTRSASPTPGAAAPPAATSATPPTSRPRTPSPAWA